MICRAGSAVMKLYIAQNIHIVNAGGNFSVDACVHLHQWLVNWFICYAVLSFLKHWNHPHLHTSLIHLVSLVFVHAWFYINNLLTDLFLTLDFCWNCQSPTIDASSIQEVSLVLVHVDFYSVNFWLIDFSRCVFVLKMNCRNSHIINAGGTFSICSCMVLHE